MAQLCAPNSAKAVCTNGTSTSLTLLEVFENCDVATRCAETLANDMRELDGFIGVMIHSTMVCPKALIGDAAGLGFELHAVQQASADSVVQTASFNNGTGGFTVPARTTAVFVKPQSVEREGLPPQ